VVPILLDLTNFRTVEEVRNKGGQPPTTFVKKRNDPVLWPRRQGKEGKKGLDDSYEAGR